MSKLLASLAFVLAGLAGRALIDKLLALQGGAVAVAGWAQLASLVDVVAGVSLMGVGTALTALVAGSAGAERGAWLKPALLLSLALSLAVTLIALPLLAWLDVVVAPDAATLPMIALLVGWLSIGPGLLVAWLLGRAHPLGAALVTALGFVPPLALLLWGPQWAGGVLANLLLGQALFGLGMTCLMLLSLRGTPPLSREMLATLLRFVPAGLAIGIMSPAATAWARAEIAASLSWHAAGQVQALWRTSEWIVLVMAGLLNAWSLPRLGAQAAREDFVVELRRAARLVALPTALLLALLWWWLPEALALLYREDLALSRGEALFFFIGDWIRVMSWVALFGLFARHAAWAIAVGECLSLPLFAGLLWLLAGRYGVQEIGMLWCATYVVYGAFNVAVLWRVLPARNPLTKP